MPVFMDPTKSEINFNGSVFFRTPGKNDVFAVVFLMPKPITACDLPASVDFVYQHGHFDFASEINFLYNITQRSLPATVNFQIPQTLNFTAAIVFRHSYNLNSSVTFIQNKTTDLPALVTFLYPQQKDFSASVYFPPYTSLNADALFTGSDELSLQSAVTFFRTVDTAANITFLNRAQFTLPAAVFLANFLHDTSATITFTQLNTHDFDATIQIFQLTVQRGGPFNATLDTACNVTFNQFGLQTLAAFITFEYPPFDLAATSLFTQFGQSELPATTEFSYPPFNLSAQAQFRRPPFDLDTPAQTFFYQLGQIQLPAQTDFRYPPFNVPASAHFYQIAGYDTPAHTRFYQFGQKTLPANANFSYPPLNLPASVVMIQDNLRDFPGAMTITNAALGKGGYTVNLHSVNATFALAAQAKSSTPPTFVATTDATGYFSFLNLTPGNYIITPESSDITFNPPDINVTITNANIQLYFTAGGALVNQIPVDVTNTTGTQPSGQSGTFSIEGFISLVDTNYINVFTYAGDETIASSFRETLGDR